MIAPHVDLVGSSARWGVEQPSAEFYTRLLAEGSVAPERIAYVGDRVDNDVLPALAAGLVAVQTPQAFLADVFRRAVEDGEGTDCASLVERAGGRVAWVEGDERLRKVTTKADLELVSSWL